MRYPGIGQQVDVYKMTPAFHWISCVKKDVP